MPMIFAHIPEQNLIFHFWPLISSTKKSANILLTCVLARITKLQNTKDGKNIVCNRKVPMYKVKHLTSDIHYAKVHDNVKKISCRSLCIYNKPAILIPTNLVNINMTFAI
jgi:hypothetical protein